MRARKSVAGKLLLTVALVALAAAACSSSKKAEPTTTPATAASTTTPTTAKPAGTPTTKSFTGTAAGAFCNLVRKDETEILSGDVQSKTPAELKAFYGKLVPTLEQAESSAPSEIKDDFKIYVGLTKNIVAAFAAVNYDRANLDPSTFQKLNTPATLAANAHVAQYFVQVCQITTPTT